MNKIISPKQLVTIASQLHKERKKIVLVGGCFDVLHIGHLIFLEAAKKHGDVLLVLVENDQAITRHKGEHRPVNTQEERSRLLAALSVIDFVLPLPPEMSDSIYDDLAIVLKPAIIATTKGDPERSHKERQAKLVGGRVVDVSEIIPNKSSSSLIRRLLEQNKL